MNYVEVRGYRALGWVYVNNELDKCFEEREDAWEYAKATYPRHYVYVNY